MGNKFEEKKERKKFGLLWLQTSLWHHCKQFIHERHTTNRYYYDHSCYPYTLHHRFCIRRPDLFMTDAATILAQQRNRVLSNTIHGKYCNKSWGWTIYLGAEADDLRVISKEALGNSWGILSAMLGHKYHQNHPETEMWVWWHLCLSVCVRAIDVWSRHSFRVTTCTL